QFGEVWHFFDQQLGYPATILNTHYLKRTNLQKFDVLVLPGGSYTALLDEQMQEKITDWVSAGGKLILMDNALDAFAGKEGWSLKRKETETEKEKEAREEDKKDWLRIYAQRER